MLKALRVKGVSAKGKGKVYKGKEGGGKKVQDAAWQNLWGKKNILRANPTFPSRTYPPLVPQRAPQAKSVTKGKRREWCL